MMMSPGAGQISTDTAEALMRRALDEARDNLDRGGVPIGSVIAVRGGDVLALGRNTKHETGEPLAHAEVNALRELGRLLRERDASDDPTNGDTIEPRRLVLVSTLEPCVMCLGAALEMGLGGVVYGLEAPSNGAGSRVRDERRMPSVRGGVLRAPCRELFERYAAARPDADAAGFVNTLLRLTE